MICAMVAGPVVSGGQLLRGRASEVQVPRELPAPLEQQERLALRPPH